MSLMRLSTRRREQSGQMLVAVIVLLALMFFIGSAMALAVSSSLHTIAQTNSMDSSAYAAESAVAKGLAHAIQPLYPGPLHPSPTVGHGGTGGNATWSYTYQLVVGGALSGWSARGTDPNGTDILDSTDTETISIPDNFGNATFELYRTGASLSDTGYIGTFAGVQSGGFRVITDTGLNVVPPPPMCTSLASLGQANGEALTSTTCVVPVDTDHATLQMWSVPGQIVPAPSNQCVTHLLAGSFSPKTNPGTIWGVIGWRALSSKQPVLTVSVGNTCDDDDPRCFTSGATPSRLLYFWCEVKPGSVTKALQVVNTGGNAAVGVFVVRAAPSGTDCVATTMGQAGSISDEADHRLDLCNWDAPTQTLWNRVLP